LEAFRKGTTGLVNDVKTNVPKGKTGNLLRSVGTIGIPQDIALLVGTRKGGGYKGWHGHLLENGTQERFRRTKAGKQVPTGKVRATHFFEEAYEGKDKDIEVAVQREFYIAIDNTIVRINRKLNKAK
jgi:hypothetical protein